MNDTHDRILRAAAVPLATILLAGGCLRQPAGPTSRPGDPPACASVLREAKKVVARAEAAGAVWDGPTTGPRATRGKRIAVIVETMTNPGEAGVARAVQEAGGSIGWNVRIIDGQGTPAGIKEAFGDAIALRPSGIVIVGFDPGSVAGEVGRANAAGIQLIGWHAVPSPGPSTAPRLFTNITTRVEEVAGISARWIIARSNGKAGVVVFTDSSVPFAEHKSQLIKKQLESCSSVAVLAYENIPVPDATIRTPQEVASLLARFGDRWTHSVAINDLYFADAAPALRAEGRRGDGPPFAIGAGDGDPSAFARIRNRHYQAATVPEPLHQQGTQIIDEFNRAFAGRPPSGYVAPVHLTTAGNIDGEVSWNPRGYWEAYRRIWGV
ncbi:substrate-binding domain-containing protein [Actinoallomurus purpureus]|uniref:substrate-binding domain-containing protein n=1 Tax=Actinoallomurus purpureus TaxID=478114 RepID=UPI002093F047|nr:substrate-binding domain-containing protein [Actinoallomurus purpureus]MCO6009901.1 substrate-binding domain-containing protein [Actinoallomurus purpureus]